jgi:uncharacterized protein with HEPN domain
MPHKPPKDERVRVRHMLDAARKALAFTQGRRRADLDVDEMRALALVRLLEIIGEAAKAVPQDIRDAAPQVPWSQIARTRDRLIHGYFNINLDTVWDIITNYLPPLVEALEVIPLPQEPAAGETHA